MTRIPELIVNPSLQVKVGFKLNDPPFSPYKSNYSYYDGRRWSALCRFLLDYATGRDAQAAFQRLDADALGQMVERGILTSRRAASPLERVIGPRRTRWKRIADGFIVRSELNMRIKIESKRRDRYPQTVEIVVADDRDLAACVLQLIHDGDVAACAAHAERMREYGVLIAPEESCGAKPMLSLVPLAEESEDPTATEGLALNPYLQIHDRPQLDKGPLTELVGALFDRHSAPNVLLVNRISGVQEYFRLEPAQSSLLAAFLSGEPPRQAPRSAIQALRKMDAIGTADEIDAYQARWREAIRVARGAIDTSGCAMLKNVLSQATIELLARFADEMSSRKYLCVDDWTGSVNREWLESDDATTFVHHLMTPLINQLYPRPLKPTYNYLNKYHEGAKLPMHKDPGWANKLTTTLTLRKESLTHSWPLLVRSRGAVHEFEPEVGDMVVMRPRQLHGRKQVLQYPNLINMLFWFQPTYRTGFKHGQEFGFDKYA